MKPLKYFPTEMRRRGGGDGAVAFYFVGFIACRVCIYTYIHTYTQIYTYIHNIHTHIYTHIHNIYKLFAVCS